VSDTIVGWAGRLAGRHVTLSVDAATLGALRAAPAIVDAITAAAARTVAEHAPGESLLDLVLQWAPATRPSATAYRDAPPAESQTTLHIALLDYLNAAGDPSLAQVLGDAVVDTGDPAGVSVRLPAPALDALQADPHSVARLTSAVQDLLGQPDASVRVRVRRG
jgi:hypothetical protein